MERGGVDGGCGRCVFASKTPTPHPAWMAPLIDRRAVGVLCAFLWVVRLRAMKDHSHNVCGFYAGVVGVFGVYP